MTPSRFKCSDECPGDGCEYEDVCMCGCPMDAHGMGSGHSPVSMHDYYSREKETD